MKNRNQHVVPLAAGWAVRSEGSRKIKLIAKRKADAISFGKEIARSQKSELIIHGRDGRIQIKNSYGDNLHPSKK